MSSARSNALSGSCATDELKAKGAHLREEFRDIQGLCYDAAAEQLTAAKDLVCSPAYELEHRIRDEPLKAMLCTLAFGFCLGALWRR